MASVGKRETSVSEESDTRSAVSIGMDWGTRVTSIGLEFALPTVLGYRPGPVVGHESLDDGRRARFWGWRSECCTCSGWPPRCPIRGEDRTEVAGRTVRATMSVPRERSKPWERTIARSGLIESRLDDPILL